MTKKKPTLTDTSVSDGRIEKRKRRTTGDDTEENPDDEVPDSHDYHDADDSDVLRPAHAMASVPEGFLDEVDAEDEDESTNNHDS